MANQEIPNPVWDGEFEDHEWRAVAAKKDPDRTRSERIAYQKGPRQHPFVAANVYSEEVELPDGDVRFRHFESQAAAKEWKARHESGQEKLKTKPLKGPGTASEAPSRPEGFLEGVWEPAEADGLPEPPEAKSEQARIDQAGGKEQARRHKGANAV